MTTWLKKRAKCAVSTAWGRSASFITISGDFPPSSRVTLWGFFSDNLLPLHNINQTSHIHLQYPISNIHMSRSVKNSNELICWSPLGWKLLQPVGWYGPLLWSQWKPPFKRWCQSRFPDFPGGLGNLTRRSLEAWDHWGPKEHFWEIFLSAPPSSYFWPSSASSSCF